MRSQEGAFYVMILRENNFDFENTARVCRGLTNSRKMLLAELPTFFREREEESRKSAEAAATRKKWVEKNLRP